MMKPRGVQETYQASSNPTKFKVIKSDWYDQGKAEFISYEKDVFFDENIIQKYKKFQNQNDAYVIWGCGLGFNSISDICEDKFGLFHLKNGNIQMKFYSKEQLKKLPESEECDEVMWIVSNRYFSNSDDQEIRVLLLLEVKPG